MTDHPLTDEMIQGIWDKVGNDIVDAKDEDLDGFVEDDLMRTAYDLGEKKGRTDMLERVIEWLSENLGIIDDLPDAGMIPRYLKNTCDDECAVVDEWKVISDLKKAMRPQQQEDNS